MGYRNHFMYTIQTALSWFKNVTCCLHIACGSTCMILTWQTGA